MFIFLTLSTPATGKLDQVMVIQTTSLLLVLRDGTRLTPTRVPPWSGVFLQFCLKRRDENFCRDPTISLPFRAGLSTFAIISYCSDWICYGSKSIYIMKNKKWNNNNNNNNDNNDDNNNINISNNNNNKDNNDNDIRLFLIQMKSAYQLGKYVFFPKCLLCSSFLIFIGMLFQVLGHRKSICFWETLVVASGVARLCDVLWSFIVSLLVHQFTYSANELAVKNLILEARWAWDAIYLVFSLLRHNHF